MSRTILVISPHADDEVLGAGACIAKWSDDGHHVVVVTLTDRGEPRIYKQESEEAAASLSPDGKIVLRTDYFTTFVLSTERSAVLRKLEEYRREFQPFAVLVPSPTTDHQDHLCVLEEARRCCKGCTLLGYEIVRSDFRFRPMLFVPVEQEHLDRKIKAMECYSSQRDKLYCRPEAIAGLARTRGAQCESPTGLAEAFSVEWAIL